MALRAGELRSRLLIQQWITTSWSTYALVWGAEKAAVSSDPVMRTSTFRTRYRSGVLEGMRILAPRGSSSLAAPLNSSSPILNVTAAAPFPAAGSFRVRVDAEVMLVTGSQGFTAWVVVRGFDGTVPTTHAAGAAVTHVLPFDITDSIDPEARREELSITARAAARLGITAVTLRTFTNSYDVTTGTDTRTSHDVAWNVVLKDIPPADDSDDEGVESNVMQATGPADELASKPPTGSHLIVNGEEWRVVRIETVYSGLRAVDYTLEVEK